MYSVGNVRSQRKTQMFHINDSYANYCSEALQKTEMKLDYENELFLNNLHLIPDPLQKNLADTLITAEAPIKVKKQSLDTPNTPIMPPQQQNVDVRPESALAGITNFFSGVFSMLSGAMFRPKSPVNYYDCFDADGRQGSPVWQGANPDVEDKNGLAANESSYNASNPTFIDMNKCKTTASSCEDKLKQVKCILAPHEVKQPSVWLRKRPKKVFVEPGSVEDSFEDAFSPEDFVAISSEPYIEYQSPPQFESKVLCETEAPKTKLEAPKTKLEAPVNESKQTKKGVNTKNNVKSEINAVNTKVELSKPEIVITKIENNLKIVNQPSKELNLKKCVNSKSEMKDLKVVNETCKKNNLPAENNSPENEQDKENVISSCEDKLTKLKELLQEKRKKNTKVIEPTPEPISELKPAKTIPIAKPADKHFKNPHRMLDKRRKMKMKRSIQEDLVSVNDVDPESPIDNTPSTPSTITSSETSLGDYFDELKGRFRSTSATESEDSFQIVFNDNPRQRRPSDCESEDSFIVFEDDCYTSNEVFGDSDSESDVSDSGCSTMTCKLSHSLSRTVSNLTDDTLYESSDEVDCARVDLIEDKGLLINENKKRLRKDRPAKKVTFSPAPPQVKVMRVWTFASRQARAGHWERFALDRDRFRRRIDDVDMAVSWVLKPQHRNRVMFQRFMPWWNKEKRRELAERREREAKRKADEQAEKEKIAEEQKRIEEEYRQSKIDLNDSRNFDAEDFKNDDDVDNMIPDIQNLNVNDESIDNVSEVAKGSEFVSNNDEAKL